MNLFRTDLAYFDGLGEVIVSVGLVKPKPNVFYQYIKYLLVLTTTVEIVVLGVKFTSTKSDGKLIMNWCQIFQNFQNVK